VLMITYLKNVIAGFPEVIEGKVATPAADYLSTVRNESKVRLLDKNKALAFHHMWHSYYSYQLGQDETHRQW
jgi:hypothetical protein